MPQSFFCRLTRPYADLSGVVARWALRCDKLVVYEHVGEETEKVHIHAAIYNANCDKKTLKNDYKHLRMDGNESHSWKAWDGSDTVITYMTKGELSPKYAKGYTIEQLNLMKDKWVVHEKYIKTSSWEKVAKEFQEFYGLPLNPVDTAWIENPNATAPKRYPIFDDISDAAKRFVRKKTNNTWSPNYPNLVKCCFYSYCFRYNLDFSDWKNEKGNAKTCA